MSKTKKLDNLGDDLVAMAAIVAIGFLGVNGIADPFTISAIAGIGGFSMREKRKRREIENKK